MEINGNSAFDRLFEAPSGAARKIAEKSARAAEQRARAYIARHVPKTLQRFIYEFRRNGEDATQAAIDSNLAFIPATAKIIGLDTLRKTHVRKAMLLLDAWEAECNKFHFEHKRYCDKLDKIAMYNVADFIEVDPLTGDPKPSLPDPISEREIYASIGEIKFKTTTKGKGTNAETTREVVMKPLDPVRAIALLAQLNAQQSTIATGAAQTPADAKASWQPITFQILSVPPGEFIPAPEPPALPQMPIALSA